LKPYETTHCGYLEETEYHVTFAALRRLSGKKAEGASRMTPELFSTTRPKRSTVVMNFGKAGGVTKKGGNVSAFGRRK
jgi:hypothetical protein